MFINKSKYNAPSLHKSSALKNSLKYGLMIISVASAPSVFTDTNPKMSETNAQGSRPQPEMSNQNSVQQVDPSASPSASSKSVDVQPAVQNNKSNEFADKPAAQTENKSSDAAENLSSQTNNTPNDLLAKPSSQEEDKFDELLKKSSQQQVEELAAKMSEEEKKNLEIAKKSLEEESKNIDIVKKMIKEVTLKKKAEKIGNYYSKDFILYSNGIEIKFPDFKKKYVEIYKDPIEYAIKEPHTKIFAKNDKVTAHLMVTIKKPNVKPKEVEVILIAQIKDGKIFRIWELVYPDWQRIIQ